MKLEFVIMVAFIVLSIFLLAGIYIEYREIEKYEEIISRNYTQLHPAPTQAIIRFFSNSVTIEYPSKSFAKVVPSNTGSMYPTIGNNSTLILIKPAEDETNIGDIILFNCTEVDKMYVHRIVDIIEFENYTKSYITKGDNNVQVDFLCRTTLDDIKYKVIGVIY